MFHSLPLSLSSAQVLSAVVPAEIAGFLGAPPLLPGEDEEAYAGMTVRVAQAVAPRDIIEWLWIKDIVDNAWESARLRRMRSGLVALGQSLGLRALLRQLGIDAFEDAEGKEVPAAAVAQAYVEGDPIWVGVVERALAERGLGADAINSEAFRAEIRRIETLDRMIAASDARRDTVLREVDRRRFARKAELRAALAEVESAEPVVMVAADFR